MDATIQSAARLMMSHKIGSLVVTDSKSKEFQGIITERDLLKVAEGVVNRDSPVSEIMTGRNKIVACSPTDSIISVMTLINNNNSTFGRYRFGMGNACSTDCFKFLPMIMS